MKTPAFWNSPSIISDLLVPVSWLYTAGAALRRILTKSQTFSVPVICVGNLTAGGGGKTPVAMAIGERFKEKNIRAYFLSRGYGGNAQGPLLVNVDKHTVHEVGDEPLLLANILPTVVSKDRAEGARFAIAQGAQVIVMDDGLQNPSIQKTLSLVVVDTTIGFGNKRVLPAGPLREPVNTGLSRADAIILINRNRLTGIPSDMPVLFAATHIADSTPSLQGKKVLAFCGLAWPQKFFDTLTSAGANIVEQKVFADHYPYSEDDVCTLVARAQELDAILVTTAKDAVRLPVQEKSLVNVVNITLSFDNPDQLNALLDHVMERS